MRRGPLNESLRSRRLARPSSAAVAALLVALSAPWTGPAAAQADRVAGAPCVVGLDLLDVVPLPDAWGLRAPAALAVDHRGNILVVDSGNHKVLVSTREGRPVTEFGGHGWGEGQFDGPTDLAVYAGFYIYVLDEGNRRVERFDVDGNYVDRVVEEGDAGTPVAVAIGPQGGLFLVDADSQTVLKRSQFDEELSPVGWFGSGGGGMVNPGAVAIGPSREIAVADPDRLSVLVFDEFGSHIYSLSLPDTLIADDLVFDDGACVLVADGARGAVLAFPPDGGPPTAAFRGDGEQFRPTALALDGRDRLLALDAERRCVFVIGLIHGDCPAGR